MAASNVDKVFASVLPLMRAKECILADIASASGATAATEQQVATIELRVSEGDTAYRQGKYELALQKFTEARALIYQVLYPRFDLPTYMSRYRRADLPVSVQIERALLSKSVGILDAIRPQVVVTLPPVGKATDVAIDKALQPFTEVGFREVIGPEEIIHAACAQGIDLLAASNPEAAVVVLESALAEVANQPVQPDASHLASLNLNLAAAHLRLGDMQRANEHASHALRFAVKDKDLVGQAQALHSMGVAARQGGDEAAAKKLLARAAETLKKVSGQGEGGRPLGLVALAGPALQPLERAAMLPVARRVITPPTPALTLTRDLQALQPIAQQDTESLTFRIPGRADSWGTISMPDKAVLKQQDKAWKLGIASAGAVAFFDVGGGKSNTAKPFTQALYEGRKVVERILDLELVVASVYSTTSYLTHLYAYALLVKIADSLHQLGQYKQAESKYLQAAGYSYLNKAIEAPLLWTRIARNALMWGHALYKQEDLADARAQYEKLITTDGHVPNSLLYKTAALAGPADEARTLIQNLLVRPLPTINWEIAIYVLTAHGYLGQILDGLDFYGLALSPIHTFEYLQSVARGFAQEAIQAEREFVNFKTREEAEASTRRDLETTKAMAQAEADARHQQYQAALEDQSAAHNALQLAKKRHQNAVDQRDQYAASSWAQIWAQAASAALGGGEDAYWSEISALADRLDRGETISGPGPKLAAAQILSAGRKSREYELAKMADNIAELAQSINVAQDQYDSATRRAAAAEIAWQAALQREQMAGAALNAFDAEFFTPETWNKMADVMRDIARSYLWRAIRIAKLMERAYNFDKDTALKVIKNDYGYALGNTASEQNARLLGGDSLLEDIDSFTYYAVTSKTRKSSRIKDVISVAANFSAQFESFRNTGLLSLETDLYEFDRLHPGFYGQRIESIEIQVIGVLPEGGLNGTLSLGGVTRYRRKNGTVGQRVHQVDTMALSEFVLRQDGFLYQAETGVRGLFQGFGLGTTWELHLPRRSNNFDFRRIFDVRLVIYYTATFDPTLRTHVLQQPHRPGELAIVRNYGLRYDFPDAWYAFYQDGRARFAIDRFRLPMNQQGFAVRSANFRVVTCDGVSNEGLTLRITGSSGHSGEVTTDITGVVSSDDAALAGLIGTSPLGDWQVEVLGGAPLKEDGALKLNRVYNVQFGLEYGFEYVGEVL